jgi:hypothetical protein
VAAASATVAVPSRLIAAASIIESIAIALVVFAPKAVALVIASVAIALAVAVAVAVAVGAIVFMGVVAVAVVVAVVIAGRVVGVLQPPLAAISSKEVFSAATGKPGQAAEGGWGGGARGWCCLELSSGCCCCCCFVRCCCGATVGAGVTPTPPGDSLVASPLGDNATPP